MRSTSSVGFGLVGLKKMGCKFFVKKENVRLIYKQYFYFGNVPNIDRTSETINFRKVKIWNVDGTWEMMDTKAK